MEYLLPKLREKIEVDSIIRDTIDKVVVLRFGRSNDAGSLQLHDVVCFSFVNCLFLLNNYCILVGDESAIDFIGSCTNRRETFRDSLTVALADVDSEEIQVYVKYFDITFIPSTIFFFNAHHMKMDSGADHTKWICTFQSKQDFIDVVEEIYKGAMKGKLTVNCPLPPDRIPKFQLLYKDV